MNQGQFFSALEEERLGPDSYKLGFQKSAIAAYFDWMMRRDLKGVTLGSTQYLTKLVFADYFVKTLLPGQAVLFVDCDLGHEFSGRWLGGHDVAQMTGNFVIHNPRTEKGVFVTDMTPIKQDEDLDGLNVQDIIFGYYVRSSHVERVLENLARNMPSPRLIAYCHGDDFDRLMSVIKPHIADVKLSYWSKAQRAGSQSQGLFLKPKHLVMMGVRP